MQYTDEVLLKTEHSARFSVEVVPQGWYYKGVNCGL